MQGGTILGPHIVTLGIWWLQPGQNRVPQDLVSLVRPIFSPTLKKRVASFCHRSPGRPKPWPEPDVSSWIPFWSPLVILRWVCHSVCCKLGPRWRSSCLSKASQWFHGASKMWWFFGIAPTFFPSFLLSKWVEGSWHMIWDRNHRLWPSYWTTTSGSSGRWVSGIFRLLETPNGSDILAMYFFWTIARWENQTLSGVFILVNPFSAWFEFNHNKIDSWGHTTNGLFLEFWDNIWKNRFKFQKTFLPLDFVITNIYIWDRALQTLVACSRTQSCFAIIDLK